MIDIDSLATLLRPPLYPYQKKMVSFQMRSLEQSLKYFGVIDEDPFHYGTWSGSSRYFFGAFKQRDQLAGVTGTELPRLKDGLIKIQNFHRKIDQWRFAYHLDPRLFEARTRLAERAIKYAGESIDCIIQVGAWYDMTHLEFPTMSYHDGNLARRLDSPYGHPRVSRSRVENAMSYERDLYQRMDHIFPMSEWLAESFVQDFGVNRDRITVAYAGVNLPEIESVQQPNYDEPNILFIGKDFRRKGGKDLLDAFKQVKKKIPKATLTIVGPSERIEGSGIRNIGPVSKETQEGIDRLRELYRSAAVFVMPTLYEPFGIVFAEAMAHGLPCIGTRICAIPEIIQDGKTGLLVEPNSPPELALQICELLTNPAMSKEFGARGFDRYFAEFRWKKVAEKIDKKMGEILGTN